jgi:8-oxo-dGTP pyrophosphatase MutT (NUDIX family)
MGILGVNVAIFRDGQILLTQRDDFHVWCMPGGHIEPGETFPQAAKREVQEETGIYVQVTKLVGIYSRPRWGEYHIAVFVADALRGGHAKQPREVTDMRFFGPDELPDALLIGQRQRIMDAFSGGEGLCRLENYGLPFGSFIQRDELYRLRDESGLSRQQFYLHHFAPEEVRESELEVGSEARVQPDSFS